MRASPPRLRTANASVRALMTSGTPIAAAAARAAWSRAIWRSRATSSPPSAASSRFMPTAPASSTPRAVRAAASAVVPYPASTSAETGPPPPLRCGGPSRASRRGRCAARPENPERRLRPRSRWRWPARQPRRSLSRWRRPMRWATRGDAGATSKRTGEACPRTPGSLRRSVELLEIADVVARRVCLPTRNRPCSRREVERKHDPLGFVGEGPVRGPAGVCEENGKQGDEYEACRHFPGIVWVHDHLREEARARRVPTSGSRQDPRFARMPSRTAWRRRGATQSWIPSIACWDFPARCRGALRRGPVRG